MISNKRIITVFHTMGCPNTMSWQPKEDVKLREDLKPRMGEPSNYATVMGVYPKDAKSQTFYFQLN